MTDPGADLLIRAGAVHSLVPGQAPQRALAVRGDRIAAVSADPNGLDHLVTAATEVHDLPGATVLPAFDDTHTHLILAGLGAHDVPVHRARNIPEFLDLIRQRAAVTPEGEWIRIGAIAKTPSTLPAPSLTATARLAAPGVMRGFKYCDRRALNWPGLSIASFSGPTSSSPARSRGALTGSIGWRGATMRVGASLA
ncbi:amidohydrolase family protein [Streptomyces milbemycinicus]|uniref:Amidohydrolase family protein n=1 Tax=Streptomyces milbemycinicus TaxID=476552 RepID=A0ABW8LL52_9ACTN